MKSNHDTNGFADTQLATDAPTPPVTGAAVIRSSDASMQAPALRDRTDPSTPFLASGPTRYEVIAEHARGGLGRVVKARDLHLGRIVAIKELLSPSDMAESLFVREALITARLQHPGIVPVIEAGRWPSGEPFYVMRLISGQPLQQMIRDRATLAERLALLPNALAVVETMAYAHSQGVIHRDIKPANVMVGDFGETIVVDWGLARHGRPRDMQPARTADPDVHDITPATPRSPDHTWRTPEQDSVSGKVVGTPAYMAPEQARGHEVDERADVYALGALLYELLTGKPPYAGSRAVFDQLLAGPPRPLAEHPERIPPDLITIADKAMARDPAHRYPTAKELADDLKRFHTGKLVSAHQYTTWTLIKRWLWRHRSTMLVALTGLLILIATGVLSMRRIMAERNIARAERAQAVLAHAEAEQGRHRLLLLQAASALSHDPTATLAWLKRVPLDGERVARARNLYDEAMALGAARHVLAHEGWVFDAKFTSDGLHLITASADGTARLLDLTTGRHRVLTRGHGHMMMAAASPDGKHLAAGDEDGNIHVWAMAEDARTTPVRVLSGVPGTLWTLTFLDARHLLSISSDRNIRVWDALAGTEIAVHQPDSLMGFTILDRRLAMRFPDNHIAVIDLLTGAELARLSRPEAPRQMHLFPDGKRLATKSENGQVDIVDLRSGQATRLGQARDGYYKSFLTVSPGGRWLATPGESWGIHLWDVHTGAERVLRGHEDGIHAMAFSGDEMLLATASDDGTARLWDLASDSVQVLRGHSDDVMGIEISPRGDYVASFSVDGQARVWPIRTSHTRSLRGHDRPVFLLRFLGVDALLSVDLTGVIRTWNLRTEEKRVMAPSSWLRWNGNPYLSSDGAFLTAASPDGSAPGGSAPGGGAPGGGVPGGGVPDGGMIEQWQVETGTRTLRPVPDGPVRMALMAPGGAMLAATRADGTLLLWPPDQTTPTTLPRTDKACAMAWSPDGNTLAIMTPFRAELWDMTRQRMELDFPMPGNVPHCGERRFRIPIAFSPDGVWLAVSSTHSALVLRNLRTGAMRVLDSQPHTATHIAFSPDGSHLAAGMFDRSVWVWRTDTGEPRRLGSHTDLVLATVFTPDGKRLATASYDGGLRLWDLSTGAYRSLHGPNAGIFAIDISPDGTWLAAGFRDHVIHMWNIREDPTPDATSLRAAVDQGTTAVIDSDGHRVHTP